MIRYAILVTGDRNWRDMIYVFHVLKSLPDIDFANSLLIHGMCEGADMAADTAAAELGIPRKPFPYIGALGRAGGPVRNGQMVKYLDELEWDGEKVVIAFHHNILQSRGTADCVRKARRANFVVNLHDGSGNIKQLNPVCVGT